MTRYELSLSTEHLPAETADEAERIIGQLVAEHLHAGYAPPDRVTIGRTAAGNYIAYATMTKVVEPTPTTQEHPPS